MSDASSLPGGIAPRPLLGIGLILTMATCFATLDTSAKYLGLTLPVVVTLFARYAFQAIFMGVWLTVRYLRGNGNLLRTTHPKFQLLRGGLLLLTSALLFFGVRLMPVAEFTSICMLSPVIVTVLAAVFLHEHVSKLRFALVAGGFVGALIVVRPGSGLFGWASGIALVLALVYAAFQLLTRRLSHLEHPLTTHFYTGFVGMIIISAIGLAFEPLQALATLRDAPPKIWALLLLAGVAGTAGHLCLILALGVAPMSVLMPFTYTQLGFASVAGWVAFNHVPDGWALVGMLVVAICGGASVWLNLRDSAEAKRLVAPSESALMPD